MDSVTQNKNQMDITGVLEKIQKCTRFAVETEIVEFQGQTCVICQIMLYLT